MLYKFKSRAAADLIMLEPHGRQIVSIIGKEPGASGILTVAQIPAAIAALEAAVADEEARVQAQMAEEGEDADAAEQRKDAVRLRQRVVPLIEMLKRSAAADADVVWGV
jgi:cyclopropane-fatty-acyl-phospholipid synthase